MRKNLLLAAALIATIANRVATADYADLILADGPVAYWRLDEADIDSPIVDRTGNVGNGDFWDEGGLQVGDFLKVCLRVPCIEKTREGAKLVLQADLLKDRIQLKLLFFLGLLFFQKSALCIIEDDGYLSAPSLCSTITAHFTGSSSGCSS